MIAVIHSKFVWKALENQQKENKCKANNEKKG